MRLLLIRHAEARGNAQHRMLGQLDELLSPHGVLQAQLLGQWLSQQSWRPTHLYCSPLNRAMMTLEMLVACHPEGDDFPLIQTDEALLEIDSGIFQGLTWQEAQEQHPELCEQLMNSQNVIPIPGGETLSDCCDRTYRFIHTLYQTHQPSDRVWVVTHGGILQYLIAAILDTPMVWDINIGNTALFEFEVTLPPASQSKPNPQLCRIHQFNECPHLPRDQINSSGMGKNLDA